VSFPLTYKVCSAPVGKYLIKALCYLRLLSSVCLSSSCLKSHILFIKKPTGICADPCSKLGLSAESSPARQKMICLSRNLQYSVLHITTKPCNHMTRTSVWWRWNSSHRICNVPYQPVTGIWVKWSCSGNPEYTTMESRIVRFRSANWTIVEENEDNPSGDYAPNLLKDSSRVQRSVYQHNLTWK